MNYDLFDVIFPTNKHTISAFFPTNNHHIAVIFPTNTLSHFFRKFPLLQDIVVSLRPQNQFIQSEKNKNRDIEH